MPPTPQLISLGLGGGRCGCHGTAATAAGWGGAVPLEGDLGERPGPVTPNVGACPAGRGGRTFRW